jgi:concanavalin A-like lectin/glucanase superfamily protein
MRKSKATLISQLRRWTAFWHPSAGMATLAVAAVGLRLVWIHADQPAHLEENTITYGSIRHFYGPAQISHDGSQFIFAATADDRGRSIFLGDTLTGKKRQIIEDTKGVGIWNDDFDVLAGPWSPDDRNFLCLVSNRLMVCSAGADQNNVIIDDKPFSDAAWLTQSKFVYVTDTNTMCLGQKDDDGKWQHKVLLSRNLPITSLTATGPDSVAWAENGEVICRASTSIDAASPASITKMSQPPTNGLALWLDASKLRQDDQASVTVLPDLSRRKNDAVENGTPPVFNAANGPRALDGKGTVHFSWLDSATNGTGLKTRVPIGISGTAPRSVVVVMRHEQNRPMMVSMGDTSAHGALFALEWSEALFLPTGWWADNNINATSTNWNLLEVVYDGSKQKGYLNGILRGTATARLKTAETRVQIGFRDGRDAKAAEGDFAELLVYDRALSINERQQVEDYLRGKWFGANSLSAPSPAVSQNAELDGVTALACSKETGKLLISRTEKGHDSLWRMDAAFSPDATPVQIMQAQSLRGAQWAGPDRIVYTSHLDTRDSIMLADLSSGGKKQLLQLWGNGSFDWFKATPKQLFLFGNISNTPAAALWRCDLETGAWHPVMSSSDYPSGQAVTALHESMNLPGGNATVTTYRPTNFDKKKKYPLVIGDTMITDPIYGEPFMTGMAACGATVAVVERPWWPVGIEQWVPNVQGLYEHLKHDPSVDTSRVYLFAASAETRYLSQLVETNSAPWRGLILLNPTSLPDFSQTPWFQSRPKILLDAGGEEHREDYFKRFQKDALSFGAVAEFYTHPGETHRMVGIAPKLQRARELKHFIFEE